MAEEEAETTPTKTVKYLREVTHPPQLAGEVDDVKEMTEAQANELAASGYVEIVEEEQE